MTDTELNIKIAEKCGWKGIVPQFAIGYAPWRPKSYSEACMGDIDSVPQDPIPDYCNDLNAMHEAECTMLDSDKAFMLINKEQCGEIKTNYADILLRIATLRGGCAICAKARWRAEAFARVFNLI